MSGPSRSKAAANVRLDASQLSYQTGGASCHSGGALHLERRSVTRFAHTNGGWAPLVRNEDAERLDTQSRLQFGAPDWSAGLRTALRHR